MAINRQGALHQIACRSVVVGQKDACHRLSSRDNARLLYQRSPYRPPWKTRARQPGPRLARIPPDTPPHRGGGPGMDGAPLPPCCGEAAAAAQRGGGAKASHQTATIVTIVPTFPAHRFRAMEPAIREEGGRVF